MQSINFGARGFDDDSFFRAVFFGALPKNGSARVRYAIDRIRVIGPLVSRFWTLVLSVGLFCLMKEYDVDSVLGLLVWFD